MNRDSKAIKAGLLKMQQDPMTTRPTARLLMDAIVLMDWLERNLNVAEFALEKLQNASSSEILDSDKGALLSQPEVSPTPKKRGRPSKNQQSVHDEEFNQNPAQKF